MLVQPHSVVATVGNRLVASGQFARDGRQRTPRDREARSAICEIAPGLGAGLRKPGVSFALATHGRSADQ